MEKIEVVIKKDGSVEYTVKGVKGKGCKDLTKFIDKLSDGQVNETKNTTEFYEQPKTDRETIKNG